MTRFTPVLLWPNGEGYTPCTKKYHDLYEAKMSLLPKGTYLCDLSNEDYNLYNALEYKLMELLGSGEHMGESVQYK